MHSKNPLYRLQVQWLRLVRHFRNKHNFTYSIIIGASIIFFWRGIWKLLDEFLFPNNPALSGLTCIIVGVLLLYLDDFELKELE